jgi:alkanesulfonate monooxygenase SsuD/methylene tetrahydromethanopterin reductase-like flavin-dependent oxidoreductase (luciferase family)
MVLGVGLGAPIDDEFGAFGEPTDARVLARRLDEGLHVLDALWSGEPVDHSGEYLTVRDVVFRPTPVQRPRVPIWVGGHWPNRAPMRRAARWDGAAPVMTGGFQAVPPLVEEVRQWHAFVNAHRTEAGRSDEPFEYVIGGSSQPRTARDVIGPLADAGATWWDERMPFDDLLEQVNPMRRRIEQGPPRINS